MSLNLPLAAGLSYLSFVFFHLCQQLIAVFRFLSSVSTGDFCQHTAAAKLALMANTTGIINFDVISSSELMSIVCCRCSRANIVDKLRNKDIISQ